MRVRVPIPAYLFVRRETILLTKPARGHRRLAAFEDAVDFATIGRDAESANELLLRQTFLAAAHVVQLVQNLAEDSLDRGDQNVVHLLQAMSGVRWKNCEQLQGMLDPEAFQGGCKFLTAATRTSSGAATTRKVGPAGVATAATAAAAAAAQMLSEEDFEPKQTRKK